MTYRKLDEEYDLNYDKLTVEECRRFLKLNLVDENIEGLMPEDAVKKILQNTWVNVAVEIQKVNHYASKKSTIEEWIRDDERRDELMERTKWSYGIVKCLVCGDDADIEHKSLEEKNGINNARVLFMFSCGKDKHKKRAFYDNGEEYVSTPYKCIKCQKIVTPEYDRKGDIITTTYSCNNCKHIEIETLELGKKVVDPLFEEDRKKFCLSKEEGDKELMSRSSMEQLSALVKDKEDNKEVYEAIEKIDKITLLELEKTLSETLEKSGFVRFHFRDPERSPSVEMYVPFVTYDNKKERTSLESTHDLARKLRSLLKGTNWRLMTDGVNYRAGVLEGRLRVYDTQSELLKLVS